MLEPLAEPMGGRGARRRCTDPDFARAARECFAAALDALPRLGAAPDVVDVVEHYHDRYVARDRCPADDLVDTWKTTGRLVPDPEGTPTPVP